MVVPVSRNAAKGPAGRAVKTVAAHLTGVPGPSVGVQRCSAPQESSASGLPRLHRARPHRPHVQLPEPALAHVSQLPLSGPRQSPDPADECGGLTPLQRRNKATLERYFATVERASREKRPELMRDVFHEQGSIVTQTHTLTGHDAIVGFYANGVCKLRDFAPKPGPLFYAADGSIAVEISLASDAGERRVGDFFSFIGDKVSCMKVYSGAGYAPNPPASSR